MESADKDREFILQRTAIAGFIQLDYIVSYRGEVIGSHKTVNNFNNEHSLWAYRIFIGST